MENKPSKRVINKIKLVGTDKNGKGGKIYILYTVTKDGATMIHSVTSDEMADPKLYAAFLHLTHSVLSILELNEKMADRITPYGISFSYDANSVMSAVINVKLALPGSKTMIALNTPKKKAPSDEKEASNTASFFTDDAVKVLWEVEAAAQLYIDGKRAQMDLFENDEGDQQGGDTKSIA